MLEIYLNLDWLKVFYLVGAIILLIIAIVSYPTLRYGVKKKTTSRK